jgi:hypothetical protein
VHHSAAPLGLRHPDTLKYAVVLGAIKDQPLRVALRAILDRFCARRLNSIAWVGTGKRLAPSRTRKLGGKRKTPLTKNAPYKVIHDEPSSGDNGVAEARMKRIVDLGICRMFAGSIV